MMLNWTLFVLFYFPLLGHSTMAQAIQCQQNEHCEIGYCCSENYTCENCDSHSNQQMIPSSKPKLNINYEISDSYKHEIGSNGEDTEKTDNFSYYGVTIMVVFLAAIGCFLIYKIFVFYRRTDDITPIIKTASAPLAPPQPPPAYNFHYNRDIANVGYCSEKLPLYDFPHVAQERDGCQMASGYNPPIYVRIPGNNTLPEIRNALESLPPDTTGEQRAIPVVHTDPLLPQESIIDLTTASTTSRELIADESVQDSEANTESQSAPENTSQPASILVNMSNTIHINNGNVKIEHS